jgi:hypothetical protein
MKAECGICEYSGDLASSPLFLCFNCADAIRRLVWLRDRERQAAEAPLAISQGAAAASNEKAAAPHRR